MNSVDGFFRMLSDRKLRCGVYESVEQLEKSMLEFIELHDVKGANASAGQQTRNASSSYDKEGAI